MTEQWALEERLSVALGEPMTPAERARLDARVAELLKSAPARRRSVGLRLSRGLLLAVGLSMLLATVVGVFAGGQTVIDPFGRPQYAVQSAARYQAEIDAAKAVTPLPPGATWPAWLDEPPDPSVHYQVNAGRADVEYNASCLWFSHWLAEQASGTPTTQAAATGGVLQMRTWWMVTDLIHNQGSNHADYMRSLFDAVEAREVTPIEQHVAVNCTSN